MSQRDRRSEPAPDVFGATSVKPISQPYNQESHTMNRPDLLFPVREILIADAGIANLDILLDGLQAGVQAWLVAPGDDAVGLLIEAMAMPGLTTLHLMAHGLPGAIVLGGRSMTAADFRGRFDGAAERDLDIAFWSCHTGSDAAGQQFVQAVAQATGARVAAASGLVGHASKGGSWNLGGAASAPFSDDALQHFDEVLAGNWTWAEAQNDVDNGYLHAPYDIVDTMANYLIAITGTVTSFIHSFTFTADALELTAEVARTITVFTYTNGFSLGGFRLTLFDTAEQLVAARKNEVGNFASGYRLSSDAGVLSVDDANLMLSSLNFNADGHTYTVTDTAQNLLANHNLAGAIAYTLSTNAVDLSVAQYTALTGLPGFLDNGHTYTLVDTVANLAAAPGLVAGASSYSIVDTATAIVTALGTDAALLNNSTGVSLSADASVTSAADMALLGGLADKFSVNGYVLSYIDTLANISAVYQASYGPNLLVNGHVVLKLSADAVSVSHLDVYNFGLLLDGSGQSVATALNGHTLDYTDNVNGIVNLASLAIGHALFTSSGVTAKLDASSNNVVGAYSDMQVLVNLGTHFSLNGNALTYSDTVANIVKMTDATLNPGGAALMTSSGVRVVLPVSGINNLSSLSDAQALASLGSHFELVDSHNTPQAVSYSGTLADILALNSTGDGAALLARTGMTAVLNGSVASISQADLVSLAALGTHFQADANNTVTFVGAMSTIAQVDTMAGVHDLLTGTGVTAALSGNSVVTSVVRATAAVGLGSHLSLNNHTMTIVIGLSDVATLDALSNGHALFTRSGVTVVPNNDWYSEALSEMEVLAGLGTHFEARDTTGTVRPVMYFDSVENILALHRVSGGAALLAMPGVSAALVYSANLTTLADMMVLADMGEHFDINGRLLSYTDTLANITTVHDSTHGGNLLAVAAVNLSADTASSSFNEISTVLNLGANFSLNGHTLAYTDTLANLLSAATATGGAALFGSAGVTARLSADADTDSKDGMIALAGLGAHFDLNGHALSYTAVAADIVAVAAAGGAALLGASDVTVYLGGNASLTALSDMRALAAAHVIVNGYEIDYADSAAHVLTLDAADGGADLLVQEGIVLTLTAGTASLADLVTIKDALRHSSTFNVTAITLSDAAGDLGAISRAAAALLAATVNHDSYTYSLLPEVGGSGAVGDPLTGTAALLAAYDIAGTAGGAAHVTVNAGATTAVDLIAIDHATSVAVDATAVTAVSGTGANIGAVVDAIHDGTILGATWSAVASTALTVAQANKLANYNGGGAITAAISDHAAATLTGLSGTHAYTIAVTGAANASDLIAIDSATSVTLNGAGVTSISGANTALAAILAASQGGQPTLTLGAAWDAVLSDASTVAQANAIDAANGTGRITTTISDGTVALLKTLTGSHDYAISVTDAAASASDLALINGLTSVTVDATAVGTIAGTVAQIAALVTTPGLNLADGFDTTIAAGSATLVDLLFISAHDESLIDARTLTTLTGTAAQIIDLVHAGNVYVEGVEFKLDAGPVVAFDLLTAAAYAHTNGNDIDASLATAFIGTAADVAGLGRTPGFSKPAGFDAVLTAGAMEAQDLLAIDDFDTSVVNAVGATTICGDAETIAAVVKASGIAKAGNFVAEIGSGHVMSAADLLTIDAATTVTVDAHRGTTITGTAAELLQLIHAPGVALLSNFNVTLSGSADSSQLSAIQAAAGSGRVSLPTSLSAPNTFVIETPSTPSWTISANQVASVIDAAGAQTIHIAAQGKLDLSGSDGHNVIVFDSFNRIGNDYLDVSSSGSTVLFTTHWSGEQIASIAMDAVYAPAQTITFSNGAHVELTLVGSTLAMDGLSLTQYNAANLATFIGTQTD